MHIRIDDDDDDSMEKRKKKERNTVAVCQRVANFADASIS